VRALELYHYRIQKTNINTMVTINLDGNDITKSISQWIMRRKGLAATEKEAWRSLSNRNLKDGRMQTTSGEIKEIHVRLYYDPKEKDRKEALLASEPSIIDGKLEIVNAITDLMD
jgi:hypothetical protein